MIRTFTFAALAGLVSMPAHAQGIGDFDCVSTLNGGDSPAGLLRIEEPTSFAFLDPATAMPGPSYAMRFKPPESVAFDDAFAEHVSPGAQMVQASWFEDSFTYEAVILTAQGELVVVYCPYIP